MGMTITEKIFAAHSGRKEVHGGEFVTAKVDTIMCNDGSGPRVANILRQMGVGKVPNPNKLVFVLDHRVPNRDVACAELSKTMKDFAKEQNLPHYYEVGRGGIAHTVVPDEGHALPGDLIVGGDSHTCSYGGVGCFSTGMGFTDIAATIALDENWFMVPPSIKFVYNGTLGPWLGGKDLILFTIGQIGLGGALYAAMEFTGEAIRSLPMSGRLTMCNMSVEAGAKNGIVPPDKITEEFVKSRAKRPYTMPQSDPDAKYQEVHEWDVSKLRPQVSVPSSPANAKSIDEVAGVAIDQAFIGSCTNGRIEDLREAAKVIGGKKVHPYVRLVVIPASQRHYKQAIAEGLVDIFVDAGAAVCTPNCGPCNGSQQGILAGGEVCIATSNRNFPGRMGPVGSHVYLANPAVAAASAILGRIASPEEVLK